MEPNSLLSNEDILELADKMLEYSDFGNFYGNRDTILEFADALIKLEKERMIDHVLASE